MRLSGIAFELLGKAKDLANDLNAESSSSIDLDHNVKGLADQLGCVRCR